MPGGGRLAGRVRVAVNVSPAQFKHPAFPGTVASALRLSGLPACRLELETAESVLLRDDAAALAVLHGLRAAGIRVALDDFGTGHASLRLLHGFPFDKVKIDRSFVQGLPLHPGSAAIVRAITGLGASLGIATAAEGGEPFNFGPLGRPKP